MTRRSFLPAAALLLGCSCHRTPPPPAAKAPVVSVSEPARQYSRVLDVPPAATGPLRDAIADALGALRTMTGAEFSVASSTAIPEKGIVLVLAGAPGAPRSAADRLKTAGPEAFVLDGTDPNRLFIVANGHDGLNHGLYEYLRQLGCRWLLPGDDWTIVPRRTDVRVSLDRVFAPAFLGRGFFASGGFGNPIPIDPALAARKHWQDWQRRNGFGGLRGPAHVGQVFNTSHKQALLAHPEYLALVNGKRVPWSQNAKLCASNADAVKLFVEDRLNALKAAPWEPVSVEPADGLEYCECERCRAIGNGSNSDQVFYLANQVAKAVAKASPGAKVSLLGYGTHAALPSFPLEPNVYVSLVPEAWQRSTLSPDELLEAWSKRMPELGIYTYWAIPDASRDLPGFNWRDVPRDSIRKWHKHGVTIVGLETSASIGSVGLGLYLASRLLWDPSTDDGALVDEFFRLAFKGAAAPMRRLMERWATEFLPLGSELATAYRDLDEARRLAAGDAEVERRVRAFEEYTEYVRLWLEYSGLAPGPERVAKAREVAVWLSRIQQSSMVSSHRMRTFVLTRMESDAGLRADFAPGQWQTAGWQASSVPIAADEVRRRFDDGRTRYKPLPIQRKRFSGKLVPLRAEGASSPSTPAEMWFIGPTEFEFEVPAGRSALEFEMTVSALSRGIIQGDFFTMKAPDGKIVHRELIPTDGILHRIEVRTPVPGRYRLRVEDQKAAFRLRPPPGVPMAFSWFSSGSLSPPLYFYVPKGLQRIAFYGWSAAPVRISDGDGRPVSVERSPLTIADVPPGQDGRVWSVRDYKSNDSIRMLNAPQSFSLAPDTVMVPEEVVPR